MHHTIFYSIILLVILFIIIYINKQFYLEGYTFIPNLTFSNPTDSITSLNNNSLYQTSCEKTCDIRSRQQDGCSGFSSDIPPNSNKSGRCTFYKNGILNINKLDHR
jgi:hypothetical protein